MDSTRALHTQLIYDSHRKSVGVAYVLWLFLGGLGAHRFYAGRTGSGVCLLLLSITGWATIAVGLGFVLLAALGIWLLLDIFLIPGMIRERNLRLAAGLTGGLVFD